MASPGRVLHLSENLTLPFDRRVWMELNALRAARLRGVRDLPDGRRRHRPHEVIDGIHVWRYPPPPATRGLPRYVWEFLYCWLQTAWLTLVVLRAARIRRHPHRESARHVLGDRAAVQAVRRAVRLRSPRPVPRALRVALRRGARGHAAAPAAAVLEWMQFRTADLVISTNESYRQVALTRGGSAPDAAWYVVRSGPSRERFATVRAVDPALRRGRRFLVAYLGVMAPQDGVDHLRARRPGRWCTTCGRDDVAFTLIGPAIRSTNCARSTRDLGLEPCVRVHRPHSRRRRGAHPGDRRRVRVPGSAESAQRRHHHEQDARIHGVRASRSCATTCASTATRPPRARSTRVADDVERPGGAHRGAARRSGAARAHGRLQPRRFLDADGVGVQRRER